MTVTHDTCMFVNNGGVVNKVLWSAYGASMFSPTNDDGDGERVILPLQVYHMIGFILLGRGQGMSAWRCSTQMHMNIRSDVVYGFEKP